MAKASFETVPELPGEEPFRPASETSSSIILFGTPATTAHGVPGHWTRGNGDKEFYPTREYIEGMHRPDIPTEPNSL